MVLRAPGTGPLRTAGADAIQSGFIRNHQDPFRRYYYRLGLCRVVPHHAQICCTSPCEAAQEIGLLLHTCQFCFGGVLFTTLGCIFSYVKVVGFELLPNEKLSYHIIRHIHIYVYTCIMYTYNLCASEYVYVCTYM